MSVPPVCQNDLEDENSQNHSRLKMSVKNESNSIYSLSQMSAERIKEMQDTVTSLKTELQCIVVKVEQNVGMFKGKIAGKISLVLNLLKKKQTHIQNTLHNCYKIIDNLVETFLNVGHELEKDITLISLKVNDFDNEIKKMLTGCNERGVNDIVWFINDEGKLTKRKNVVLSSTLPRFKCGDKKMRKTFVSYLNDVFTAFQVPKDLWVKLASNRLTGMAQDWWKMHDTEMKWHEFVESFVDWSFNDNGLRKLMVKLSKDELLKNGNQESFNSSSIPKRMDKKHDFIFITKSNYSLGTTNTDESDDISTSSTSSEYMSQKRKISIYTASTKSEKKRKVQQSDVHDEKNSTKKGRYKLRKRK